MGDEMEGAYFTRDGADLYQCLDVDDTQGQVEVLCLTPPATGLCRVGACMWDARFAYRVVAPRNVYNLMPRQRTDGSWAAYALEEKATG